MNWLGWSTAAVIGALFGASIGAAAYAFALSRGWDAPYFVGLCAGFGALVMSPDKSGMRALLVATAAIWVGAVVQAHVGPFASEGLAGFHATLTPMRLVAHGGSGAVAFALSRTSLRREATKRAAGA